MALSELFQSLFLGRRGERFGPGRDAPASPGSTWRPSGKPARLVFGARVRLRTPIASPHTVHIPAGATGVVVGADARGRQVRVELDSPRTVLTVPGTWLEGEPDPPAADPQADPPASA
jgi:hypothetical protein